MSEEELDGSPRRPRRDSPDGRRELEAIGGRREEIEELERDREAIKRPGRTPVPGDLDRLTPGRGTRSTSISDLR